MKDAGDKVSGHVSRLKSLSIIAQGSWEKRIIERINNQRAQANRKIPREDDCEATPKKRGRPKASSLLQRYPTLKVLSKGILKN